MLFAMKGKKWGALGISLMTLLSVFLIPNADALTTGSTIPPQETPSLYLTAYQRLSTGIQFVQLYNSGDTLVDISKWHLKNENGQLLEIQSGDDRPKWLTPGAHVIASLPGIVTGARATLAAEVPVARLTLVPPAESNYRTIEYELKAASPSVWRRNVTASGAYSTTTTAFSEYSGSVLFDDGWYEPPAVPPVHITEIYPYASDCSPHDASVLCGDYVKLYNPTGSDITLNHYVLRTSSSSVSRTSANTIHLDGVTIHPGEYLPIWLTDEGDRLSLTNSGGYIWFEDTWGIESYVSTTTHYENAGVSQQGYGWVQKDDGSWAWTSSPQPLSANKFTAVLSTVNELDACPVGKYRSPETNRCRTIEEAVNALATCPEGQYRNPETNRCRSAAVTASASLTPCKEGQERNPETNRCRSIASAVAELIPCDEGEERNPVTNRCRKVQSLASSAATTTTTAQSGASNNLLPWVLAIAGVGVVGYGVFEWRQEIGRGLSKLFAKFKK